MRAVILLTVTFLGHAPLAGAQCLDWSRAYPPPGIVDSPPPFGGSGRVDALVADDSGGSRSLILAGEFHGADSVVSPYAVRWNGTGYQPLPGLPASVLDLWRIDLGAGPVVYAGVSATVPSSLFRLAGDAWIPVPGPSRPVKDLVAFDSGHGLELHALTASPVGASDFVHRLSPSGWVPLAGGLDRGPEALAVFDDGSGPALYAAGDFRWQQFGSGPMVRGVGRWSNGIWVEVGGGLTRSNGDLAMPIELVAHDFGSGPRLVVGGIFENAGGQAIPHLAAWDGSAWSAVVPTLDGSVLELESVVLPSGPKLAVSGLFASAGGSPARPPILVDGASVIELGPSFGGLSDGSSSVRAFEAHDDGNGPSLFVGGRFVQAGPHPASGIARWDGSAWHALTAPDGVVGPVLALERHDDGSGPALYAGGELKAAGGTLHREVARFDGASWSPVGPASTPTTTRVLDLHSTDLGNGRRLYAGGQFTAIGGATARSIAVWDGAAWAPLAGGDLAGTSPAVLAMTTHDDGAGPALYVAGAFEHAGAAAAVNVARWTPNGGWSSVGGGMPSPFVFVNALAAFDDGSGARLYAGSSSYGLFRFDGVAWQQLPAPPQAPGQVYALGVYPFGPEPLLFVGGQYQTIGGVGALNLAAWTGSSWRTFGEGATGLVNSNVRAFHLYDDGQGGPPKLAAAGYFGQVGGAQGASVAIFDGAAWQSPEGGGVNGTAMAVASLDDGDGPSLFAGGYFTATNASIAVGFARYGWRHAAGCAPRTGTTFCDGSGGGAACPCGNVGLALHGCGNSANAEGARLRARGAANATDDSVTLDLAGTTPSAAVLFFQGSGAVAGGAGAAFGDGVRCVGGAQVRLGTRFASAGVASFGAGVAGDPLVSVAGGIGGAATRTYQAWYRDPNPGFCTSATFNLTNGLEIRWAN